jgi:hypothetical protein
VETIGHRFRVRLPELHVSETPFAFAVQVGSGLVFVLLWRLSPARWSRIGRRVYYYGRLLNSVLGIVPLVIAALWLMFGVLVAWAAGRFGDYPTGNAETEWLRSFCGHWGLPQSHSLSVDRSGCSRLVDGT